MVTIQSVEAGSAAQHAGIEAGDRLVAINGHEITDVLDFRFYETEARLTVQILDRADAVHTVHITKPRYAGMGLEFATYLMDKEHACRNKCIFCFIDQLPPGMRESLYFKDDDARLSFLFGNYVTMTNMTDKDVERIVQMHISPINVSVHTMDPDLRCRMMGNRFAGKVLSYLEKFVQGGIQLNCQLVLCPGINDGPALEYTLEKLSQLGENLQSIACVPVGVTRYREGLFPLTPYTPEGAGQTLQIIERFGDRFVQQRGSRTVYASDEFYLLAGLALPPEEYYEGYPQIENGVGMLTSFRQEFNGEYDAVPPHDRVRTVTVVCGEGVYAFMKTLLDEVPKKWHNLTVRLLAVHNSFFGGTVNVSGLLTGQDMAAALQGKSLGDEVLIPGASLRRGEDVFLDDMTLDALQQRLGVKVTPSNGGGDEMLRLVLGEPSLQA